VKIVHIVPQQAALFELALLKRTAYGAIVDVLLIVHTFACKLVDVRLQCVYSCTLCCDWDAHQYADPCCMAVPLRIIDLPVSLCVQAKYTGA
jgi:hypothetical protein